MALEVWMPLIGVGVGWLLSQFSYWIREREDRKEEIRLAISRFLTLAKQLHVIDNLLLARNKMEEQQSVPDFITRRDPAKSVRERLQETKSRLVSSADSVARIDPLLAEDLETALQVAGGFSQSEHVSVVAEKMPGVFRNFANIERSVIQTIQKKIERTGKRLALKVSPILWWRVRGRFEAIKARQGIGEVLSAPLSDRPGEEEKKKE